jgi:hypothetical protein
MPAAADPAPTASERQPSLGERLVPVLPDTNLFHFLRRNMTRNDFSAAAIPAGVAAALVATGSGLIGLLFWIAQTQNGCSAKASFTAASCEHVSGANGYLTDWNAVLWSVHGAPVVIGASNGPSLTMRIPLGTGMLLVAVMLYVAGRLTVRYRPVRTPPDALLRAGIIAVAYTVLMLVLGGIITARGDGYAVGPEYGLLALWSLILAFTGSFLGILRSREGAPAMRWPGAGARERLGRFEASLRAAALGSIAALALAAIFGVVAMLTHTGDTANIVRAAFSDLTTNSLPDTVVGTVAAVVFLLLAAPSIACWVLVYSLVIPTVSVGTLRGSSDFGLAVGMHDAYFWVVIVVPLLASMLTGFAAARLRRVGSVEEAMLEGTIAGLAWAVLLFVVIALLDGAGTLSSGRFGGAVASVPFGPGLQYTFAGLLLFGVVGSVVGAYLSLVLVRRIVRLAILRRYNVDVVGSPVVGDPRRCAECGQAVRPDARFCATCGAAVAEKETSPAG